MKKACRLKPRLVGEKSVAAAAGELFDPGQKSAQPVFLATSGSDDPGIIAPCEAFGDGIGD